MSDYDVEVTYVDVDRDCGNWFDGSSCSTDSGLQVYFEASFVSGVVIGTIVLILIGAAYLAFRGTYTPKTRKEFAREAGFAMSMALACILTGPIFFPLAILFLVGLVIYRLRKDIKNG